MRNLKRIAVTLGIALISLVAIYPFYIMIVMSTYETTDLYKKINMIPGDYLLTNLKTVFDSGFTIYYWNSFYTAVLTILFSVTISTVCGYAFA